MHVHQVNSSRKSWELRLIDPMLHDLNQYLHQNMRVTTLEDYNATLNLEASVKHTTGGENLGRPLLVSCFLINCKINKN